MSDLATEMTSSLDRSGRGAMLAPLKLTNGTAIAPSLSWSSETRSGPYRFGSGDIRWQMDGTTILKWLTTGTVFPLAATTQAGLTATNSSSNGPGVTSTGNGTGAGLSTTGGNTSGAGIVAAGGAPNGYGAAFSGDGTGAGVFSTGGDSSGHGLSGTGGSPNGIGVVGFGTGAAVGVYGIGATTNAGVSGAGGTTSGSGVYGSGGTPNGFGLEGHGAGTGAGVLAVAGGSSADAVDALGVSGGNGLRARSSVTDVTVAKIDGYAEFVGGTRPASTTGFIDTLTRSNIIKAWGNVRSNGSGAVTITDAFNIASCAVGSPTTKVTCNIQTDMANANYAVLVSFNTATSISDVHAMSFNRAVGSFDVGAVVGSVALDWNTTPTESGFSFIVLGSQ
jgi:hypothetical protein